MYDYARVLDKDVSKEEHDAALAVLRKNRLFTINGVAQKKLYVILGLLALLVILSWANQALGRAAVTTVLAVVGAAWAIWLYAFEIWVFTDGVIVASPNFSFGQYQRDQWRQVPWEDIEYVDARKNRIKFKPVGDQKAFEPAGLFLRDDAEGFAERLAAYQKRGDIPATLTVLRKGGSGKWVAWTVGLAALALIMLTSGKSSNSVDTMAASGPTTVNVTADSCGLVNSHARKIQKSIDTLQLDYPGTTDWVCNQMKAAGNASDAGNAFATAAVSYALCATFSSQKDCNYVIKSLSSIGTDISTLSEFAKKRSCTMPKFSLPC